MTSPRTTSEPCGCCKTHPGKILSSALLAATFPQALRSLQPEFWSAIVIQVHMSCCRTAAGLGHDHPGNIVNKYAVLLAEVLETSCWCTEESQAWPVTHPGCRSCWNRCVAAQCCKHSYLLSGMGYVTQRFMYTLGKSGTKGYRAYIPPPYSGYNICLVQPIV